MFPPGIRHRKVGRNVSQMTGDLPTRRSPEAESGEYAGSVDQAGALIKMWLSTIQIDRS